jgi:hypothetical protein
MDSTHNFIYIYIYILTEEVLINTISSQKEIHEDVHVLVSVSATTTWLGSQSIPCNKRRLKKKKKVGKKMKCHKIHDSNKDEGTNNSKTMILHTALWLGLIFDTSHSKKKKTPHSSPWKRPSSFGTKFSQWTKNLILGTCTCWWHQNLSFQLDVHAAWLLTAL